MKTPPTRVPPARATRPSACRLPTARRPASAIKGARSPPMSATASPLFLSENPSPRRRAPQPHLPPSHPADEQKNGREVPRRRRSGERLRPPTPPRAGGTPPLRGRVPGSPQHACAGGVETECQRRPSAASARRGGTASEDRPRPLLPCWRSSATSRGMHSTAKHCGRCSSSAAARSTSPPSTTSFHAAASTMKDGASSGASPATATTPFSDHIETGNMPRLEYPAQ